jgi:hypothetical protein
MDIGDCSFDLGYHDNKGTGCAKTRGDVTVTEIESDQEFPESE